MESLTQCENETSIAERIINITQRQITSWIDLCEEFRQWERAKVRSVEAPPDVMATHKKALAQVLKTTRYMLTMASDPEGFENDLYEQLFHLNAQLQHSWDMFYNPPTPEEEARMQALTAEIFPE